jgi:hypothetical protein
VNGIFDIIQSFLDGKVVEYIFVLSDIISEYFDQELILKLGYRA